MVAAEVATLLQEAGFGALGETIFQSFPDMPDDATTVAEYPGGPPVHVRGRTLPAYEQPRVQVLTRSPSYRVARTRAERIYRLLDGFSGTVQGVGYGRIAAVQSPFFLGQDDRARHMIVTNFSVIKELSPIA